MNIWKNAITPKGDDPKWKKIKFIFGIIAIVLMLTLTIILMLWSVINNTKIMFICLGVFLGLLLIEMVVYLIVCKKYQKKKILEEKNRS